MAPACRGACGLPFRPRAKADPRAADLSTELVRPDPYPEMGPEIVATHRELVREAAAVHGTDVDAISAAVCIPRWNVGRALHALGLAGPPEPNPKFDRRAAIKPTPKAGAAHAWLSAHGRATTAAVCDACGLGSLELTLALLRRHPERFRRVRMKRIGPALHVVWEVCS